MDEKRDGGTDSSGESPPVASALPETLPASTATPIPLAVNGELGTIIQEQTVKPEVADDKSLGDSKVEAQQHETVVPDSELSIQQNIPDASTLSNDDSVVESLGSNIEQGDTIGDILHTSDQIRPTDVEASYAPGAPVVVSSVAVAHELADSSETLQKEVVEIPQLGHLTATGIADDNGHTDVSAPVVASSEAVGNVSVDLPESLGKEAIESSQPGDAPSIAVHTDSSATVYARKSEEKPSLSLAELKYQKNAGLVKQKKSTSAKPEKKVKHTNTNRGFVDTAAPFESVKEAVTKFGGIVDWKAHKAQALERRQNVLSELEKVHKEVPEYKKQSEAAEKAKAEVLMELENTKKNIEELKVNLERAQTEETQAKQDSELAELRVKEIEQGIVGESSIAVKTQQEVAKARHEAAIAELMSVKEELKTLQEKYSSLSNEREIVEKKAEEAVLLSKEVEKTAEDLTLELITIKESLESAQTSHMEAEEHRMGASLARDQDLLAWEEELKKANEEVLRLTQQLSSTNDVKSQLDKASAMLVNLKAELAAYMQAKISQESGIAVEEDPTNDTEETSETQSSLRELASTRNELEEVKATIEKAKEEVNILKVAASSIRSQLEKEKGSLNNLQQREGMASIAVSSLEAELERTKQELEVVRMKEKEAREQMIELPKLLQQAAQEADEAKSAAQSAQEELRSAKELSEQAKASVSTTEIRLQAALKEIEAAKASERLALSAIKALEESEQAADQATEDSPSGVTLPLPEYFNLSKKAHEAEELAHERVEAAMAQIAEARQSELSCLQRLEEAYREMNTRKESLRVAKEKAEKAKEGKLGAEQDLRKWRAESEQRRKASDAAKAAVNPVSSPQRAFVQDNNMKSFNKQETDVFVHPVHDEASYETESSPGSDVPENKVRKKKKSFFPRILLYLARRTRQQRNTAHT